MSDTAMAPMWLPDVTAPDSYVEFRGVWELAAAAECTLGVSGAAWFVAELDGAFLCEGPVRFPPDSPVCEEMTRTLPAGRHELRARVHHVGVDTRMLLEMPPFFAAQITVEGKSLEVRWQARPVQAFRPAVRRLNPELGWIEWCDTRRLPAPDEGWREVSRSAVRDFPSHGLAAIVPRELPVGPSAEGALADSFGYALDDPPVRFFLRRLSAVSDGKWGPGEPSNDRRADLRSAVDLETPDRRSGLPSQAPSPELPCDGRWWRFDLGQVRLGRPRIELDLPRGAAVELGYCEALHEGRVAPWLNQSLGLSCHLDHYEARGGRQTFGPLSPRGLRYLEVHVLAAPAEIRLHSVTFLERSYFPPEPAGAFGCEDPLLNRIWQVGVATLRACAEDAVTDCPTRERGQWLGDVVNVGLATAAAAYPDLRLFRRGLVQAAECAREDGLVASLFPGQRTFLSSYALNWVEACWRYYRVTADASLLAQLRPAAERNLDVFLAAWDGALGIRLDCWRFLDWGHTQPEGHGHLPLLLHFHGALVAFEKWTAQAGTDAARWTEARQALARVIRQALDDPAISTTLDYHESALLLRARLVTAEREVACLDRLEDAFRDRFPWRQDRSRAGLFQFDPATDEYPTLADSRIVTPYFAHFLMPELARRGRMDFVLEAYRRCWGWALEQQSGTWLELFDSRSSQCHQWSACPTWQMSEFLLGLRAARNRHPMGFQVSLVASALPGASGVFPIAGTDDTIALKWTRLPCGEIEMHLHPSTPIRLYPAPGNSAIYRDLSAAPHVLKLPLSR